MYRAVTWAVLQRGLDLNDEPAVTRLAEETLHRRGAPQRKMTGAAFDVLVDGQDATWESAAAR